MRRNLSRPVLITSVLALLLFALSPVTSASAATTHDCATQAAANPDGWYKSRYEWCKIEPISAGERVRGAVVGNVTAIYDVAITTERLSQNIHVDFQIRKIVSWGTLTNASLSVQMICQDCGRGKTRGRTAPLSDWERNANTTFDFVGSLGKGPDKISSHIINPRFILNGKLVYSTQGATFRCDAAAYIAKTRAGCVFPRFIPTLTYHLKGDVPVVAQHISDALNHPASTLPAWRGKTIQSRYWSGISFV